MLVAGEGGREGRGRGNGGDGNSNGGAKRHREGSSDNGECAS